MSKWQDISTAPRDNSPKLAWGIWQGEINGICAIPGYGIITSPTNSTDHDRGGEGWWNLEGGDAYATWMKPTYWMPLPDPPEEG